MTSAPLATAASVGSPPSSPSLSSATPASADVDGRGDDNNKCPPLGFIGYNPTVGCVSYYWCQDGVAASVAWYKCAAGLMFDALLSICNWEALASGQMWTPS